MCSIIGACLSNPCQERTTAEGTLRYVEEPFLATTFLATTFLATAFLATAFLTMAFFHGLAGDGFLRDRLLGDGLLGWRRFRLDRGAAGAGAVGGDAVFHGLAAWCDGVDTVASFAHRRWGLGHGPLGTGRFEESPDVVDVQVDQMPEIGDQVTTRRSDRNPSGPRSCAR